MREAAKNLFARAEPGRGNHGERRGLSGQARSIETHATRLDARKSRRAGRHFPEAR